MPTGLASPENKGGFGGSALRPGRRRRRYDWETAAAVGESLKGSLQISNRSTESQRGSRDVWAVAGIDGLVPLGPHGISKVY